MKKAILFKPLRNNIVECLVCERRCQIMPGHKGVCGNYLNINGALYHFGYGRISAIESRPIEIKPLFHYWPNSTALTFSNWGCNLFCPWCQNHHISFRFPREEDNIYMPHDLLRMAILNGDEGFSASFNEPTTNFDFLVDLTELAKNNNLYFMIVTNGYLTISAIDMLIGLGIDGWSIDIKGCPNMKKALASIDHSIVYRNARHVIDLGGHVEMVYLVVKNTNDFNECVEWIIDNHINILGSDVPLHINRYFPAHVWREPATDVDILISIADRARKEGIEYVYVGNVHDPELETTRCPKCGKILIRRVYYRVTYFDLDKDGERYKCPRCGYIIPLRGRYIPWK